MNAHNFRRWMMIPLAALTLLGSAQIGRGQNDPAYEALMRRRAMERGEAVGAVPAAPAPIAAAPQMAAPAAGAPQTTASAAMTTSSAALTTLTLQAIIKDVSPQEAKEYPVAKGDGLVMNFRGVGLDTVLTYLSKAAGLVIIRDAAIGGTVDVISQKPLSKDEAVQLLNSVLNQKGYAAIQNERILKIISQNDARFKDLPVKQARDPKEVEKTDVMVTMIIPVRYSSASQIIQNLQPLMPPYAVVSANESSNAILLTATQTDVRRMMEIIAALDTSISDLAQMKVYMLKWADASAVAQMLNDLYRDLGAQSSGSSGRGGFPGGPMGMMFGRFGDRGRGGSSGGSSGDSAARRAAQKVTAVAETRMNALVVSAPNDLIQTIDTLIEQIDQSTEQVCEIRVFTLRYSDATQMAQLINDVFQSQSSSSSSSSSRSGFGSMMMSRFMFGGRSSRGGFGGSSSSSNSQSRMAQETMVYAVPDIRTNSIVVNASSSNMEQIAPMIERLDLDPARDKKVYVYPLKYADAEQTAAILDEMFGEGQTTGRSTFSNTRNTSPFSSNSRNSSSSRTSSSGSSGRSVPSGLNMN